MKMPKSTLHFLLHHENGLFIVRIFCVLKEVPLYNPTITKFLESKKINIFAVIYFIPILRHSCEYISLRKLFSIPNLAQYMVISKYIKIWNRNFMCVRRRVVSSILTVSYQKNTEDWDWVYFEAYKKS
jgi:hypothetical protein